MSGRPCYSTADARRRGQGSCRRSACRCPAGPLKSGSATGTLQDEPDKCGRRTAVECSTRLPVGPKSPSSVVSRSGSARSLHSSRVSSHERSVHTPRRHATCVIASASTASSLARRRRANRHPISSVYRLERLAGEGGRHTLNDSLAR